MTENIIFQGSAFDPNQIKVTSGKSGSGPTVQAIGEASVDLNLAPTGSGNISLNGPVAVPYVLATTNARSVSGAGGFPYLAANAFLFEQTYLTGTATGAQIPANLISGTDAVKATTAGAELDYIRNDWATAAGIQGNRAGFLSKITYGGKSSNAGGTELYAGVFALVADANDNGTAGGLANLRGGLQAINGQLTFTANATYWTGGAVGELDYTALAPIGYKYNLIISQQPTDAYQGTYEDAAISVRNQANGTVNGGAGWKYVFGIGSEGQTWPVAPTGTIIAAIPNSLTAGWSNVMTAAVGIDFFNCTFSVTPIKMPVMTNAVDDAAAALAGIPVGGFYRNGSVVMQRAA